MSKLLIIQEKDTKDKCDLIFRLKCQENGMLEYWKEKYMNLELFIDNLRDVTTYFILKKQRKNMIYHLTWGIFDAHDHSIF